MAILRLRSVDAGRAKTARESPLGPSVRRTSRRFYVGIASSAGDERGRLTCQHPTSCASIRSPGSAAGSVLTIPLPCLRKRCLGAR